MRLNHFAAFHPLKEVLDITFKTPQSFHHMFSSMPYDVIDGTVIEREGRYFQLVHGDLNQIDKRWVNEKRGVQFVFLCYVQ